MFCFFNLTESVSGVYLRVDGRRLAGDTWVPVRDRAPLEVSCVAEGKSVMDLAAHT